MLLLHLLGGQNFDHPWSNVFIGIHEVLICAVKSVEVIRVEQASDRDGGTGVRVVRNKSKCRKLKTRYGTVEFSKAVGSIASLLHHDHGTRVSRFHFLVSVVDR